MIDNARTIMPTAIQADDFRKVDICEHRLIESGPAEICLSEVGSAEVGTNIRVFVTPRVPSFDATLPLAHSLRGWIYLWHKKHDEAEKEAQLAVQFDPNFAEGYARLGHIVAIAGRPEEGIGLIRKALRLDPHSPFLYSFFLGHALASLRRDQEAVDALRRALSRNPEHIGSRQYLAASLWHLEYLDEAKAEAEALLRVDPDFSVNAIASRIPEKRQQMLDRHVAALRALQLPD